MDNVSIDFYCSFYWFFCNYCIGYNVVNDVVIVEELVRIVVRVSVYVICVLGVCIEIIGVL